MLITLIFLKIWTQNQNQEVHKNWP